MGTRRDGITARAEGGHRTPGHPIGGEGGRARKRTAPARPERAWIVAFLVATLALPPRAAATGITWTGGAGDNLYTNPGNWSPAVFPNSLLYDASMDNDFIDVNKSATLDSLTIGGNGTVNVGQNAMGALSGVTLTLGSPSTPGSIVLNNGGALNVGDGDTLMLASSSSVSINNSVLTLNAATGNSSLIFNSGGSAANFTLTGGGTVYMSDNAGNSIAGLSGAESLTNDITHTIQGAGAIGGFSSFTNAGTLTVNGSNALNITAPLSSASWDGANLIGGTYNTSGVAGGNIELNLGAGVNSITGITNNANVTLNGALLTTGVLTAGQFTDALSTVNAITDSSLTVSYANETIAPSGGTLAVSTSGLAGLSQSSLNVSGGDLTISGDLTNTALGNSSTIMLNGGSVMNVSGGLTQSTDVINAFGPASTMLDNSSLTLGGAFTQLDTVSTLSLAGGSTLVAKGLNNQGVITVDGSSSADFRTGTAGGFANLSGGVLTGGAYAVNGNLYYDADPVTGGGITALAGGANITLTQAGQMLYGGAPGSAGTQDLTQLASITDSSLSLYSSTLQNIAGPLTITTQAGSSSLLIDGGTLTIGGGLNMTSAGLGMPSSLTVQDNSTLTVQGLYSQGFNTSTMVSDTNGVGSRLYAQGFSNGGEIDVDANSVADFRAGTATPATGTFANLSGGVLTGGTYNVSGSLYYDANSDGGQIAKLQGANVTLNGGGQMLYGGTSGSSAGTQAFTNLSNLTDSTFTLNNATALTSVAGGLTIDSVGASSSLNLNGTDFRVNGNLTATGGTFVSAVNVESGSALAVNGNVNISGDTTVSGGSSLSATGSFTQNAGALMNVYGSTVSALGLTNNGSIFIDSASTGDFRTGAAGGFTNLSSGTLTGGSYAVAGTLLVDGSISKIASGTSLTLEGTGSILTGGANGSGIGTAANALSALAENDGTLALSGGASLTTTGVFTNKGTVTITGTASQLTAATEYLQSSGSTTVTGTLSSSDIDIAGGSYIQSSKFTNSGAFMLGAGATANFSNGLASLGGFTAGTLSTGTWDIAGTMTYSAGGKITDIASGATVDLIGAGVIKTANANALSTLADVGGTLDISGGDSLTTTSAFLNTGVVNVSGGPGVDSLTVTGQFANQGTVTVGAGDTLTASGGNYVQSSGATYLSGMLTAGTVQIDGGTLFGTGTVSGNLLDASVVNPGDPGTLTVTGNYTQTSAGELILDVDGATTSLYDNLAIGGNVGLNGTLDVNLESSFLSSIYNNETFQFLTFNSGALSGNFSTVEYSVDGNLIGNAAAVIAAYDLSFSEQVNANNITFAVVVTPEPATWLLLSLSLLVVAAFEYRRRGNAALRIQ